MKNLSIHSDKLQLKRYLFGMIYDGQIITRLSGKKCAQCQLNESNKGLYKLVYILPHLVMVPFQTSQVVVWKVPICKSISLKTIITCGKVKRCLVRSCRFCSTTFY